MGKAILANVGVMYGILIGANLPAPLLGLQFGPDDRPRLWYEPPGYVIPIIWFVLFAMLGGARAQLVVGSPGKPGPGLILWLAVLCATYAYYTLGLARLTGVSALWFGLFGNLLVIAFAIVVAWVAYRSSAVAGSLVAPIVVWTAFATVLVFGKLRQEGLLE